MRRVQQALAGEDREETFRQIAPLTPTRIRWGRRPAGGSGDPIPGAIVEKFVSLPCNFHSRILIPSA